MDPDGRRWKDDSAHIFSSPNMGDRPNLCYEWKGFKNPHASGWRLSKGRLEEEYQKGNFEIIERRVGVKLVRRLVRKVYEDDYVGENRGDFWGDIVPPQAVERLGYPTQKPIGLLERIISASTKPGEWVLDPFCGCATACAAAERLGRKWIGIDISPKAYELVKVRLVSEAGLKKFVDGREVCIHRDDMPVRVGVRSPDIKHRLYGRQEGHCNGCRVHFRVRNLEVDHIIPVSGGGMDGDGNLQLLCGNCNRIKGDRSMEYLIAQLRKNV